MSARIPDRITAGQLLAKKLTAYANLPQALVLALPRGGVPVAGEIARALHLPLDICVVRKLGVPDRPELAMGAIALGEVMTLNEDVIEWLKISPQAIAQVVEQERQELTRRDRAYRRDRPAPLVRDRTIILVDDGIATGSTLTTAIKTLQAQKPLAIVVAVPVAPWSALEKIRPTVDEIICLIVPDAFRSISLWYDDFSQTSDEEVRYWLAATESPVAEPLH